MYLSVHLFTLAHSFNLLCCVLKTPIKTSTINTTFNFEDHVDGFLKMFLQLISLYCL